MPSERWRCRDRYRWGTKGMPKRRREDQACRRPSMPFDLWFRDTSPDAPRDAALIASAARLWNRLPSTSRAPYQLAAERDQRRYQRDQAIVAARCLCPPPPESDCLPRRSAQANSTTTDAQAATINKLLEQNARLINQLMTARSTGGSAGSLPLAPGSVC